jgi:hypothetical protein
MKHPTFSISRYGFVPIRNSVPSILGLVSSNFLGFRKVLEWLELVETTQDQKTYSFASAGGLGFNIKFCE